MNLLSYQDIINAQQLIEPYVHRTPVFTSSILNDLTGSDIHFKGENLQKVGAFKARGACNAIFSLSDQEASNGVVAHSSGNHAAALALAAKMRGVAAHIVMPDNSPEIKKKAVAGYGAKITYCEPTLQARESTLAKIVEETGATEIHPYNNFNI